MLKRGNTYSKNIPTQIPKWSLVQKPPHSYFDYKNDIGAYSEHRITGLRLKRLSSPFTGNYIYLTSNDRQFSNYYDAYRYQTLLNQGFCEEAINKLLPNEPDFTYDIYSLARSMNY